MKAKIYITLKSGVLDPQGKATQTALAHLGFDGVNDVRQGKMIEVSLTETDADSAKKTLTTMCEKLLANTVIEDYRFDLVPQE